MRALIIDDSKAMRSILKRILADIGFDSVEASNGREALEVLNGAWPLELALVDWNMPEMSGIEFVREVRKDSKFQKLRLMMVTTETEMEHVSEALKSGANEYVMKPFTKEILLDKLKLLGIEGKVEG